MTTKGKTFPADPTTNRRNWTTVLSGPELEAASAAAKKRDRRGARLPDTAGFSMPGAGERGARGEVAAAKILGLPWLDHDSERWRKGGEVGHYEIRTGGRPGADLVIRPKDEEGRIYVLALEERISVSPGRESYRVRLAGWLTAGEAKRRNEWFRNPGGHKSAWFVPQSELRPIADLPHLSMKEAS